MPPYKTNNRRKKHRKSTHKSIRHHKRRQGTRKIHKSRRFRHRGGGMFDNWFGKTPENGTGSDTDKQKSPSSYFGFFNSKPATPAPSPPQTPQSQTPTSQPIISSQSPTNTPNGTM